MRQYHTKKGHNVIVELMDINTNAPDIIKYSIHFLTGNIMIVTKELPNSSNVPYIGYVLI